jgi:hypothetical protein
MELYREVGVSFEAVAREVRKIIHHLGEDEANASASMFFSPDQQQTSLTESLN